MERVGFGVKWDPGVEMGRLGVEMGSRGGNG